MKNKYLRMSKDEQKKALEEYKNSSDLAKDVVKRLKRVRIISIIGLIYGIGLTILNIATKAHYVDFISAGITIIACLILFLKAKDILIEKVNSYIVGKIRTKQKEDRKKELKELNKK